MLAALCIFDFLVLCFVDSPLQQNLLGGSIYEDAGVRARVKRFTRHLLAGLVGARDA